MIHLFFNCCAASAGGGLTYLRNLAPHLSERDDVKATIVVGKQLLPELPNLPKVKWLEFEGRSGAARRFAEEQALLPKLIREAGADVLISAGNFALRKSPVPQILLSGNSLYLSPDFRRDLLRRREYALWLDNVIKSGLAKRSIRCADCAVAPTEAFADSLRRWAGAPVTAIHHGFDRKRFLNASATLSLDLQQKFGQGKDSLRLLFVSHYNYYRNFESLLRAIPLVREGLAARDVKLFLTCKLEKNQNPGSYCPESARRLVRELNLSECVVELGAVPHSALSQVYKSCDIYVTPAYTETFAFPLVEAMACGLPVVASDLAVHREICGPTARYFPAFSPKHLAAQIVEVASSDVLRAQMKAAGEARSRDFSWGKHLDQLVAVAQQLLTKASANSLVMNATRGKLPVDSSRNARALTEAR